MRDDSSSSRGYPRFAPRGQSENVAETLDLLTRGRLEEGWRAFLRSHSQVIMQVVGLFARDEDAVSDCFLFCCGQLSRRDCRRLRRFDPDGPASFTTWLHAVVYNLCRDWRRRQGPRRHGFRSIAALSVFEQEVFHLHFERGVSSREVSEELRPQVPGVTETRVATAIEGLSSLLTKRQRWLLQTRSPRLEPLANPGLDGEGTIEREIPNGRAGPEVTSSQQEQAVLLDHALADLPASDRLLLRLRFEQSSTLAEIAELLGLKNAQAADRQIDKALERLRRAMVSAKNGKASAV